jgi:starch synthase
MHVHIHAWRQGYAWEITTPEGGWGLDKVLQSRQHVLNGITNGIDMAEWDPATDAHTPAPFSVSDLSGKAACKAALQAELGFEQNHEVL